MAGNSNLTLFQMVYFFNAYAQPRFSFERLIYVVNVLRYFLILGIKNGSNLVIFLNLSKCFDM
jgi:hypothetical protein